MNTHSPSENTALAKASAQQAIATNVMVMDSATMDSMMRVAELMASGRSTVPAHLQKNPADCMAVVMQAMQWKMNPFAVAQKTHLVSGALGYEAQLVNAVIQSSNSIDGRFHYEFKGTSPAVECRVGAVIKGESEITWGEWLCENKVTTKNSPLWKTNPKQQLGYLQVKNWARLYCPGAILGVYSQDELEEAPPKNMGEADVVQPTASHELIAAAESAASHGLKAYQDFFKAAGHDNRKLLAGEHERLKSAAAQADRARTVETPAQAAPATAAAPAQKTFAQVKQMLMDAKNMDQLAVAGDWIGELSAPEERAALQATFEEQKFVLEME